LVVVVVVNYSFSSDINENVVNIYQS